MRSRFKFQAITALAMGAFLSGQEAMAWCPNANDRTINCNNCTVTLTCDVPTIGPIIINGYNVTFDGNWFNLYTNSQYGIYSYTYKGTTTIKNIYINGGASTNSAIYSRGIYSDVLRLQNVYANGSLYGLQHSNDGKVEITGGSYWDNAVGIYGYGGNPTANGVHISGGGAWANNVGVQLSVKNKSTISNGFSAYQNSKGAYLLQTSNARITNSYFDANDGGTGGHGLEVYNSPSHTITGNSGHGNTGYDCKISGNGGATYSNDWGTASGDCN